MTEMILTGMKRRKKDISFVSIVTFVAVLFMTGITLFQNIMNEYVYQTNLHNYGDWIVSSVHKTQQHPYFQMESSVTTGTYLINSEPDDQGKYKSNGIQAGKADADFVKTYTDIMYEGRMPQADDEIAMDILSLALLGYSYDLGQTIVFTYPDENEQPQQAEYKLVGTLKNYSATWCVDENFALPNFFVTEQEFEKYKVRFSPMQPDEKLKCYTTYFYQLNPEYENINTHEFASSFVPEDAMLQMANPVTYNRYVYENMLWGSQEMFENVTTAIMLIAALAIGYLLIAYTGKRRETYYRYRCIGATKMQVRGILTLECLYATIPQMLLGLGTAYGLAIIACLAVEEMQYELDGILLFRQIATVLIVLFTAIIVTQISVSDKRLAGNTGKVKPVKFKQLRIVSKFTRRPEKSVFRRQSVLHPLQGVVSAIFSVIVCGCLVLCVFKIYDSAKNAEHVLDWYKDFTMNYTKVEKYHYEGGNREEIWHRDTFAPDDLSLGVDESFIEAVQSSPGIKDLSFYWVDGVHYFHWDGIESSQIMHYITLYEYFQTPLVYGTEMYFYPDIEDLKKELTDEQLVMVETTEGFSWEAVAKGEQAILFVGTWYTIKDEMDEWIDYNAGPDDTVHAGDTMEIRHFQDDFQTPVTIGAVIQDTGYMDDGYHLFGTKELAERILENEGKTLRYNRMEITYDSHSSYESTDKQLAALAVNNGMEYKSSAEQRRLAIDELLQDIGIYGVLFAVVLIVYITLQNSFFATKTRYMQESYHILKRIGMADEQYRKSAFWSQCRSFLWVFAGLVFGYMLILQDRYIMNVTYGTAEEYIVYFTIEEVKNLEHWIFIAIVTVIYLIMVGNGYFSTTRKLKK